jgi:hypothetical protein
MSIAQYKDYQFRRIKTKDTKTLIAAMILSGSVGLTAQTSLAESTPGSRPLENQSSEKQLKGKSSPSKASTEDQGTGTYDGKQ